MIRYLEQYLQYIEAKGVGSNDVVASSPKSYVSYMNSVAELLGMVISPQVLSSEEDIHTIKSRLKGKRADKTIRNYVSAMKQYVSMVAEMKLR